MSETYDYCPSCGTSLADAEAWPLQCGSCDDMFYRNPTPVSVLVQPVGSGVLTIRRAIEPEQGELALPGGFVGLGETWEEAAAREMHEETGWSIEPEAIEIFDVESAPDGTILIFGEAPPRSSDDRPDFDLGEEVSECAVVEAKRELAFPLHTEILARWLEMRT